VIELDLVEVEEVEGRLLAERDISGTSADTCDLACRGRQLR
jgi:hypothetical protein